MRQPLLVRFVFGIVASTVAVAQHGRDVDPDVITAQQKFHNAVNTCNLTEIRQMTTEDMLFIHSDGHSDDKKAYTDAVAKCPFEVFKLDVKTARMYGDTAILTGNLLLKAKQSSMTWSVTAS